MACTFFAFVYVGLCVVGPFAAMAAMTICEAIYWRRRAAGK